MAFLEWRKFNFFDLNKDVDEGKISAVLKDAKISCFTSGHGHLVLGDSEGNIHLITRLFQITTVRAYEAAVTLAEQLHSAAILVTVGIDSLGSNSVLKVWNLDKVDKQGQPTCVRVSKALPANRMTLATAVAVHENMNLMVLGFQDGSIILYRGDILRERSNKLKVLKDSLHTITGLAFRTTSKLTLLFVSTTNSVFLYNITSKDKEIKIDLDGMGCARNCAVLAENVQDSHFMIGRDNAVYGYTPDGRGPCYAVDGRKVMLQWFRSYLIIVAKESKSITHTTTSIQPLPSNDESGTEKHMVTVLDIQNKFMVFSACMVDVQAILTEWGSFYVVCGNNKLYQLHEIDLQSKLALLFKKNLYDVSIRIAKSQQYDAEGLVDIFRQYGDHLYTKGDHNAAIEQYIKTIGKLEPSYVIRKFLDSQHIDNLTTYLQALHKQGLATEDHTTLLLNCYTKLDKTDKLKEFIMTKDREVDFDVEIAIKVCRKASTEDALLLAKKHGMHDWYLKIQLEDRQKYREALEYIGSLEFEEAEENMKKYGSVLIENVPEEATQFLKKLCTEYKSSSKPLLDQGERANPEDFIHLFLNNSERLVEFLEYLVKVQSKWSTLVYNTLIEHYLHVWSSLSEPSTKAALEQKIVRLLQNSSDNYDKDQTLILCQFHNFRSGILYLYEESKLYQQILQYHITQQDYKAILATCRRFSIQDNSLWVQALWACAKDADTPSNLLQDILTVIDQQKLLSPLLVIDILSTSTTATVGDIRTYLLSVLQNQNDLINQEQQLIDKYTQETQKIREQIKNIQTSATIFQGSRCSACHHQLELPSIHFLCQHSYHEHCFQSFSENENECPVCLPENKKILDIIRSQEQNRDIHEKFHQQLERSDDGFSLVADYFGRGVFNKVTVITMDHQTNKAVQILQDKVSGATYGPGAEAKLRLSEGKSNISGGWSKAEGRLRTEVHYNENHYGSGMETSISQNKASHMIPTASQLTVKSTSPRHSPTSRLNRMPRKVEPPKIPPEVSKNPFSDDDDDGYDESKNPFAGNVEDNDLNPFSNDDDYDKNLNPFEA